MSNSLAPYLIGIVLLLPSCNHVLDEELLEEVAPVPINMSIGDSYITTRSVVTDITTSNLSSVGIYAAQEGSTAGQFPWTATPFAANIVPTGISNGQLSFASKLYYPLLLILSTTYTLTSSTGSFLPGVVYIINF